MAAAPFMDGASHPLSVHCRLPYHILPRDFPDSIGTGMQWGARSSDALAALRTLRLNEGWEEYWQGRSLRRLTAA